MIFSISRRKFASKSCRPGVLSFSERILSIFSGRFESSDTAIRCLNMELPEYFRVAMVASNAGRTWRKTAGWLWEKLLRRRETQTPESALAGRSPAPRKTKEKQQQKKRASWKSA